MCTVRKAVAECEKFFCRYGYLGYKRNYEFTGPYGGYIIADIKRLDKLRDSLYRFNLIDRPCNNEAEVYFDFSEERIYIRICTVLLHD